MRHNPLSRFLRFLMSILGLGFLAGSLLALRTDDSVEKDPRKELARRLRRMAERIESDEEPSEASPESSQ